MDNYCPLPTDYQTIIHKLHYARWLEEEQRRENWDETIDRYFSFFEKHFKENFSFVANNSEVEELKSYILNLDVMPSMRALWSAGPALERDNAAGFNCSALSISRTHAWDEALYLLSTGTGVGFSVERQFINDLPVVPENIFPTDTVITVRDSRIGWASALRELITLLYAGVSPKWDLSRIRPAGARLKIFGGRASGGSVFDRLLHQTVRIFTGARGRKLNSLECHDLLCYVGEAIVAGGVRRSACLSLSNLSDLRMRDAKSGDWRSTNPQRSIANNSVCYTEQPGMGVFIEEWQSLYESKSGERGIFNREGITRRLKKEGNRDANSIWLTNPCSEVILRDREMCNLSQVTIRPSDTIESVAKKARIASVLGTWQSTLTNFRYLSAIWRKNCEEERLLGVSLTGICDNPHFVNVKPEELQYIKDSVIQENIKWANRLGINHSVSTTCIKPAGNSSQAIDSASGIHPRYASHYIRGIQISKTDPMGQFLKDMEVPCETYEMNPNSTDIFYFPQSAPKKAIVRKEMTALQQLELAHKYQIYYASHQISCTVYVREHEWLEVGAWVYKNFDDINGLSFLPFSEEDHGYKQLPYRECSEQEYKEAMAKMPEHIDWQKFQEYEKEDVTTGAREFACVGNACELQ